MPKIIRIYTDGACRGNPGPAAFGWIICDETGKELAKDAKYLGEATNNIAEYSALIGAMQEAARMKAGEAFCFSDSKLVVGHMNGWKVKKPHLKPLFESVQSLRKNFSGVTFSHLPREHPMIAKADALANRELEKRGFPKKAGPFQ
jgi:ribonuclease HI